jgi:AcrR family transcriptional regulator
MARTLNPTAHAVRRDVFIDAAQRLIQTRGYEQMSVQDVLDELDASRGAFYHYFDSKEALLEAVVERMADGASGLLEVIVADPERTATQKFEAVFARLAQFKAQRKDLVLAVTEVWLSDDNAIVREKLRRMVVTRLGPVVSAIVRQGVADGEFTASHPDQVAGVLVSLIQAASDTSARLLMASHAGMVTLDKVESFFAAYSEAFERILAARPGSIRIIEPAVIRFWFG